MPPAILVAIASFVGLGLTRIALANPLTSWWGVVAGGIGLAALALLLVGMLQLRQRIAAVGFGLMLAVRLVSVGVSFDPDLWLNATVRDGLAYSWLAAHLVVMIPLAMAVWSKRPALAICAVASALIAAPPPVLLHKLYSGSFRQFYAVDLFIRMPQYIVLVLVAVALARRSEPRPAIVADGLRHGYRAMCAFSAFAAIAAIAPAHIAVPMLEAAALAWFAFGLLHAARSPLNAWEMTFAAALIMLASGVLITSLPAPFASPTGILGLLGIVAAWLVTRVLTGTVEKEQLQAKGIGSVVMFATALAMVVVLVPRAQTEGALIALRVLGGFVIALGAWMLSWLCRLGAESLERRDSGLPAARVVSGSL